MKNSKSDEREYYGWCDDCTDSGKPKCRTCIWNVNKGRPGGYEPIRLESDNQSA